MTIGILPTKIGMVGATPIIVNAHSDGFVGQPLVRVQISSTYIRKPPEGWPITPPGFDPNITQPAIGDKTLAAGTIMTIAKCEADALVAAGAATII